jgi:outer membrane protein assembly factor BamA
MSVATSVLRAWLVVVVAATPAAAVATAVQERGAGTGTIAELRVQGNVLTPDDEVFRAAGVAVGAPFAADTLETVATRLRADRRFKSVEVLKRFASISDPTQITLVIVVDEGPVKIERTGDPTAPTRVVASGGLRLLFLPVLNYEDGYGFTYGVRLARPDVLGPRSRLSLPLTWGGDKRAGIELEKSLERGPLRRVQTGAAISRQTHPYFDEDDDRRRVFVGADSKAVGPLRADLTAAWEQVSFGGERDRLARIGGGATLDTRIDPVLARNAVFARVSVEHLSLRDAGNVNTIAIDLRGYVGLFGQTVLVLRGQRDDGDRTRPPYLRPLLGGMANLRGFKAGTAVGDTLTAASAELRAPITSPLSFGKLGINVFVDTATVYDEGGRLADQRFDRGIGAGVWFAAAFLRLNLSVARGLGHSTRVNFGATLAL